MLAELAELVHRRVVPVEGERAGHVADPVAEQVEPPAEVDVLVEHEEALVEAADARGTARCARTSPRRCRTARPWAGRTPRRRAARPRACSPCRTRSASRRRSRPARRPSRGPCWRRAPIVASRSSTSTAAAIQPGSGRASLLRNADVLARWRARRRGCSRPRSRVGAGLTTARPAAPRGSARRCRRPSRCRRRSARAGRRPVDVGERLQADRRVLRAAVVHHHDRHDSGAGRRRRCGRTAHGTSRWGGRMRTDRPPGGHAARRASSHTAGALGRRFRVHRKCWLPGGDPRCRAGAPRTTRVTAGHDCGRPRGSPRAGADAVRRTDLRVLPWTRAASATSTPTASCSTCWSGAS